MSTTLIVIAGLFAALVSLWASSLTYALRDFSRVRFSAYLQRKGLEHLEEKTVDHTTDLIFVTALFRLFANLLVLIFVMRLFHESNLALAWQYLLAVLVTGIITLLTSVAIPHAIAKYAGSELIGFFVRPLHTMSMVMRPVIRMMHGVDSVVAKAAGHNSDPEQEQVNETIQQEILSVVEEGEKEGVVDEHERQIIESVIQFRHTTAAQIMTARPDIVGIEVTAKLFNVKEMLEESGHSRVPVYEGTLDKIVGVLYARDLLKYLGVPSDRFDIRSAMRPTFYVPETKPLRDLLNDFRLQKVHIAIVLDEYGGTAGLVTIEDIIEELIGDISDEHEPQEPAMLKKINDNTWEADARIYVDELNRSVGLNLADDAGYDTLGGFVSTTLGRIPEEGATFEHETAKYTILESEPQRVKRVRIELAMQPVTHESATETTA